MTTSIGRSRMGCFGSWSFPVSGSSGAGSPATISTRRDDRRLDFQRFGLSISLLEGSLSSPGSLSLESVICFYARTLVLRRSSLTPITPLPSNADPMTD